MKTGMSGANRRGMVNARQNKDEAELRRMKKERAVKGATVNRLSKGTPSQKMQAVYMAVTGAGDTKKIRKKEESNRKRARIRYGDNNQRQYKGGESKKSWMNW